MRTGNWVREHRGIYRLALFPGSDRPDLVLWALWSRNRNEVVEGVYSHETALSIYEVSDLNPSRLNMTVPTHFRRNSKIPDVLQLHYANLPPQDVQASQGYNLTRPLRTVLDVIQAGTVEPRFIRQAIQQALDRGLIAPHQIEDRDLVGEEREMFAPVMRRVAHSRVRPSR